MGPSWWALARLFLTGGGFGGGGGGAQGTPCAFNRPMGGGSPGEARMGGSSLDWPQITPYEIGCRAR